MAGFNSTHFINRELSWLAFNERVLEEVRDPSNPLLERIKFFTIFSSNLDEYFEVRVAGLKQQIEGDVVERSPDGLTPLETFHAICFKIRDLVSTQYECWRRELLPALAAQNIRFPGIADLEAADLEWINQYYRSHVRPVVTPLALDSAHPFPQLLNKSLNMIVQLEEGDGDEANRRLAIVQVPRILPRLVRLPRVGGCQDYLFLGKLIGHYLGDLFPGMHIAGYWLFRVTRNGELYIEEEESENLLKAVENELRRRRRGEAVRLEIDPKCPPDIRAELLEHLHLSEEDVYEVDGPMNPGRLMAIGENAQGPELRDPPFASSIPALLRESNDYFAVIRKQDILLHHPYESFETVVDFLEQAASDPRVLAIKQTLYRTGGDSRIVGALMKAVNNGKQVTAVVELRARFDEANNIEWTRRLEDAGVHVVYGLVGLKIHAKICLIVRREDDGIQRYVHLSTGNYNPTTARIYTDLGLLTCHPDFGEDATNLFNLLTGISQFQGMRQFCVAPFELQKRMVWLIDREADHAQKGLPARIIAKMNSLVDKEIIQALYRASQAGVKIDLLVRGICCLRPQIKGVSANIVVRSIVDRFLEHSRVFYFENACQPEMFVGSADWMPRNLYSRIEIAFPVKDGVLRHRIREEILEVILKDNVKARYLQADGSYVKARPKKGEKMVRSQVEFMKVSEKSAKDPAADAKTSGQYRKVKVLTKRPR
jgi:polyphosphate kinase